MSWAFWRSTKKDPDEAAADDPNAPPPEMDLSELLSAPPPEPSTPAWMDAAPEEVADPVETRSYLDVDLQLLRKNREHREAQGYFWARLKRGEVGMADVPMSGAAGNAAGGLITSIFTPVRMFFGNLGVIFNGVLLIVVAGLASMAFKAMFDAFFGPAFM